MRVLLDECVPRRLRDNLGPHVVRTVPEMSWAGIKNGQLLQLASSQFDCFLTVDRNLQFQQNVGTLPLAVLVVEAGDNRVETLMSILPRVVETLATIVVGELRIVSV